jgi:hypothetical protein
MRNPEREPTRVREGGRQVTRTNGDPAVKLAAFRRIVDEKSFAKIDGYGVDLFSASAVVQIHDALNEQNRARYLALSVPKMADVAFRLINRKD